MSTGRRRGTPVQEAVGSYPNEDIAGILDGPDLTVTIPDHYGGRDNPYEVVKIINHYGLSFQLGNTLKYIVRAGKKDPAKHIQDLHKAQEYISMEITRLEEL